MRILFFDLEFAGLHKNIRPGVCEFGYVITDENFKVLERDELVINPSLLNNDWDWWYLRKMAQFSKEEYLRQPKLYEFYDDIKSLIESADLIVGHSLSSDVYCLQKEFERLHLEKVDYIYYDIVPMYKKIKQTKADISLVNMLGSYNLVGDDRDHLAEADAYNTMLVFEKLVKEYGKDVQGLLEDVSESKDSISDGRILSSQEKFNKGLETFKLILESKEKDGSEMKFSPWTWRLFIENLHPSSKENGIFKNNKYCFDKNYVRTYFRSALNLSKLISDEGGQLVNTSQAKIFITSPLSMINNEVQNQYEKVKKNYPNLTLVNLEKILSDLKITQTELDQMPYPSFKFLLDKKAIITSAKDKKYIREIKNTSKNHTEDSTLGNIIGDDIFEKLKERFT